MAGAGCTVAASTQFEGERKSGFVDPGSRRVAWGGKSDCAVPLVTEVPRVSLEECGNVAPISTSSNFMPHRYRPVGYLNRGTLDTYNTTTHIQHALHYDMMHAIHYTFVLCCVCFVCLRA